MDINKINIIISGNLTGFSSFYETSNAGNICTEAKFDFDYRNHLTFLANGEKVYAISFAKDIVAVSLVTRILDSFRRSGILVISVLLKRGNTIGSVDNPYSNNAIYRLLNEINDKFYEKNFMNGMINQNPAVLMQDYYSDILSGYKLVPDNRHRRINSNIDAGVANKQSGYIAAAENDVPIYLSSLYRRSYEGFHNIFFGKSAPQNIEEVPEEVLLYNVYITNNGGMTLPAPVKLTDPIYRLSPNPGEVAFNQNYTYGDVVQGKAGSQLKASIVGERLEITYLFKEEEKTIKFVFEEGGNTIPLSSIVPIIQDANGNRYNLSSDSFKFKGKEIYGRKTLECTTPQYIVSHGSSTIELERLSDGATCHVQVESTFPLYMKFDAPHDVPKTITLTRTGTSLEYKIENVTKYLEKKLPGKKEEWEYRIESDEYRTCSGEVSNVIRAEFKPKPVSGITGRQSGQENRNQRTNTNGTGRRHETHDESRTDKIFGKLNLNKILLVSVPLAALLLYIGISNILGWFPWNETPEEQQPEKMSKSVVIKLKDDKGQNPNIDYNDNISIENLLGLIAEIKESGNITVDSVKKSNYNEGYKHEITANSNCNVKVTFYVKMLEEKIDLCEPTQLRFDDITNNDTIELKLNVLKDHLNLYDQLLSYIGSYNKKQVDVYKSFLINCEEAEKEIKSNKKFKKSFENKRKELQDKVDKSKEEKRQGNRNTQQSTEQSPESPVQDKKITELDRWNITIQQIKEWKKHINEHPEIGKKTLNDSHNGKKITVSQRIEALEGVFNTLKDGYNKKHRPSVNYLSKEQADFINKAFKGDNEKKINRLGESDKFKKINSLEDFKEILDDLNINWNSEE